MVCYKHGISAVPEAPCTVPLGSLCPHGKGQSGGSSKRPEGGLETSKGHPVPPPRGFGPVHGGHRGRRDGLQHEAPSLVTCTCTCDHGHEGVKPVRVCFADCLKARPVCKLHARSTYPTTMQRVGISPRIKSPSGPLTHLRDLGTRVRGRKPRGHE